MTCAHNVHDSTKLLCNEGVIARYITLAAGLCNNACVDHTALHTALFDCSNLLQ
jgi:hypothetical protein